jgi:hypothetical protein
MNSLDPQVEQVLQTVSALVVQAWATYSPMPQVEQVLHSVSETGEQGLASYCPAMQDEQAGHVRPIGLDIEESAAGGEMNINNAESATYHWFWRGEGSRKGS